MLLSLTSQLDRSKIHHQLLEVGVLNGGALRRLVGETWGEVSKSVREEDSVRIFLDLNQESDVVFLKEALCEIGMHVVAVVHMNAEALHLQHLHHLYLLGKEGGAGRAHTKVNRALLLSQLLFR